MVTPNQPNHSMQSSFIDSFWGTEDDDDVAHEVREFYERFLEQTEKLKAEIVSHDTQEGNGKKYTVYNIKVTTDLFSYTISKRFSLFDRLRNQIKVKYKELDLTNVNFPAKTFSLLWGADLETIEKRRVQLNEFLQFLCAECKRYQMIEFLEFLEIKKRMELSVNNQTSFPIENRIYTTHSQDVAKLIQYVDLLNKNPDDSCKILKELETFYLQVRPKLPLEAVKSILVGRNKMKGLIHFCGKIDPESASHLVCAVGLNLLNVFFDYSTCPDAELFINLLGSLPLKYINLLHLNQHIEGKSQKQCKSPALKITELYLNRNPSLQAKDILTMEGALKEFEKWRQTKINNSKKAECYEINEEMTHNYQEYDSQVSPTNSLTKYADNPTKQAEVIEDKVQLVTLFNDKNIKIKYYKNSLLKIRLLSTAGLNHCAKLAKKGVDYYSMGVEEKKLKEIDFETYVYYIKVPFQKNQYKSLVFLQERKSDKNKSYDEKIQISEKPSKDYSIMLDASEVKAKRTVVTDIKPSFHKNSKTKIKVLITNLDEYSQALQEYLIKPSETGEECVLVQNCLKFLEDLHKPKS